MPVSGTAKFGKLLTEIGEWCIYSVKNWNIEGNHRGNIGIAAFTNSTLWAKNIAGGNRIGKYFHFHSHYIRIQPALTL